MKDYYPKINYNNLKIIDISRGFIFKNLVSKNSDYYFYHTIKNWISPEKLAFDYYGSCDYVWLIFLANNIVNPYDDWLLSDNEFKTYVEKKYGSELYDNHHYEYDGIVYPLNQYISYIGETPYLFPNNTKMDNLTQEEKRTIKDKIQMKYVKTISNYEYENRINEAKRNVRIIYPSLIPLIDRDIKALFS